MFKRCCAIVMTMVLFIGYVFTDSVLAEAASDTIIQSGDWGYTISDDGTAVLKEYYGMNAIVLVPSEIDGYHVTRLYQTFYDNKNITNVTVPEGIVSLESTFEYCDNLIAVQLPDSLLEIGVATFRSCISLKEIELPQNIDLISFWAFYKCRNLQSIIMPDSVAFVAQQAFQACSSLKHVELSRNITSIMPSTFEGCSSLQSIEIPANVQTIYGGAFAGCSSLQSIKIPASIQKIDGDVFTGCDSLESVYISDIKAWCNIDFGGRYANPLEFADKLYVNGVIVSDLIIPEGTLNISSYAFLKYSGLTSVTIPKSVESIGEVAFAGIQNLKIYGYYGSCAHKYANENGISFVIIDSYKVVYNTNGGKGGPVNQIKIQGIELVLSSIQPTRAGHVFKGWSISEDGSVVYTPGQKYIEDSNVTLYAVWEPIYTVTYDANGGYGAPASQVQRKGETLILASTIPYKSECVFWGWSTSRDGAVLYANGATYREESDITLYAQWGNFECLECNGNGVIQEQCKECKGSGTIKEPSVCVKCSGTGKELIAIDNWSSCQVCNGNKPNCANCDGKGKVYAPEYIRVPCSQCDATGVSYDYKKCPTCLGQGKVSWQCNQCNNGSTQEIFSVQYYIDRENVFLTQTKYGNVALAISYEVPVHLGVQFLGWATAIGGEIEYYQGDTYLENEDLQLYAVWSDPIPSAPTVSSYTDTKVILIPLAGGEYSLDGITWQTSNVFENLSPSTDYTFYQRYAKTDTHEASVASRGTSVTTDKSKQTLIPIAPIVQSITVSSITLAAVDGCEYSKDGITWQSSPVFDGLSCGTKYTFYQRYKETADTYTGNKSDGVSFRTDKGTQTAPSKPTLSSRTHNSVTLTKISGYEYSMDGITWQTNNVFIGLNPETNYLFYQRKAETDKYYASEASSSLTVKTKEMYQSIIVSTLPNKTSYLEGKDKLDLTGGKISLCYPDGSMEEVAMTADMVTGFNNSIVGNQKLIVNHEGYTTTFTVQVVAKSVTSIEITTKPTKLTYLEGDTFDKTGMVVTAYYNNNTSAVVTDYTVSGYTSTPGSKTITVAYGGKTAIFTVTVDRRGSWKQNSVGWWYQRADGTYPANCWEQIDGKWYYFNASGYRVTGWLLLGGEYYYLDANGVKVTNRWIGNYYLKDTGIMAKNEIVDGIYVGAGGEKLTGWLLQAEGYYYYKDGVKATGWLLAGSTWYYLDPETGIMLANEWLDDTYYLTASGAMATGWLALDGTWYYLNAGGAKVTNSWVGNYYMDAQGHMATNAWVDNGRYYVDASGAYVSTSGWFWLNGEYYYLSGGLKQTGWILEGSTWYYMDPETGVMLANEWLNDTYYMTASGAMATGWLQIDGNWYYFLENGAMASNQWIGSYYIGSDGIWVA